MWEFNKHEKKELHERIQKFSRLKEWTIFKAQNFYNEEKTFIVLERIRQGIINVLEIDNSNIANIIQNISPQLKEININSIKNIHSIIQTIIKND